MNKAYDVLVVGAGIAGLTTASYLLKGGLKVLVCERSEKPGGLVADFKHNGYHFDAGLRAVENSGIILPMLRQLGIKLEFLPNPVSIRIGDKIVRLEEGKDKESLLNEYGCMLKEVFPHNAGDIDKILDEIRRVMSMMDVLYGIDNPLFLDLKSDPKYLVRTLLPWLFRYTLNMRKMKLFQAPIEEHLARFTSNQAMIDTIAQHFFRKTPSFFALSYFGLYLDYMYPKGGTGSLVHALTDFLHAQGGELRLDSEIISLNPEKRQALTADGITIEYMELVWAADMKALYQAASSAMGPEPAFAKQAKLVKEARGGDSVLSVFYELDLKPAQVQEAFGAHSFYTPITTGLSNLGLDSWTEYTGQTGEAAQRRFLENWIRRYLTLTTFEISSPVLRDGTMAPQGHTGLIISTLFSADLVAAIEQAGWYKEFKQLCIKEILLKMDQAIPGISEHLDDALCSTPLTIKKQTANADGAITGWSFLTQMPAEARFKKIANSINTPLPHVYQAGQWTFSPSGLPISVLTGKLAADAVLKVLSQK